MHRPKCTLHPVSHFDFVSDILNYVGFFILDSFDLLLCLLKVIPKKFEFKATLIRGVFITGAMGALAPAMFGHFSTVEKNYGC